MFKFNFIYFFKKRFLILIKHFFWFLFELFLVLFMLLALFATYNALSWNKYYASAGWESFTPVNVTDQIWGWNTVTYYYDHFQFYSWSNLYTQSYTSASPTSFFYVGDFTNCWALVWWFFCLDYVDSLYAVYYDTLDINNIVPYIIYDWVWQNASFIASYSKDKFLLRIGTMVPPWIYSFEFLHFDIWTKTLLSYEWDFMKSKCVSLGNDNTWKLVYYWDTLVLMCSKDMDMVFYKYWGFFDFFDIKNDFEDYQLFYYPWVLKPSWYNTFFPWGYYNGSSFYDFYRPNATKTALINTIYSWPSKIDLCSNNKLPQNTPNGLMCWVPPDIPPVTPPPPSSSLPPPPVGSGIGGMTSSYPIGSSDSNSCQSLAVNVMGEYYWTWSRTNPNLNPLSPGPHTLSGRSGTYCMYEFILEGPVFFAPLLCPAGDKYFFQNGVSPKYYLICAYSKPSTPPPPTPPTPPIPPTPETPPVTPVTPPDDTTSGESTDIDYWFFSSVFNNLKNAISVSGDYIWDVWKFIWWKFDDFFPNLTSSISSWFSYIGEVFNFTTSKLWEFFSDMGSDIVSGFGSVWSVLSDWFSSLISVFTDVPAGSPDTDWVEELYDDADYFTGSSFTGSIDSSSTGSISDIWDYFDNFVFTSTWLSLSASGSTPYSFSGSIWFSASGWIILNTDKNKNWIYCKLYQNDGSFVYYPSHTGKNYINFSFSSNSQNFFQKTLLIIPEKLLNVMVWPYNFFIMLFNFFTPMNEDTQVCILWQVKTIKYQESLKYFSHSTGSFLIVPEFETLDMWKETFLDYLVLFILSCVYVLVFVSILFYNPND